MSLAPLATCVQFLEQLQLLEPAHLDQLRRHDPQSLLEPRALLQKLVGRGWLTPFQGQVLAEGRGHDLVVGPYVVLSRLGEGNMGEVFRARHRTSGTPAALKLIRPDRLSNSAARERFRREVWLASRLAHPNLVTTLDASEADGKHFLAMELLEGTDLGRLVEMHGPLPVPSACEYIRQAAQGLQYADEHRLVHRDIKPGNLFLTRDGTIKVLDLGLARLDDPSDAGMTCDGAVVGTPDFMAPEQARSAHSADIRADLYALGCTLYYLLTGHPPFPGGSTVDKLLAHQRSLATPVSHFRSDVPPDVEAILARLLAKDPAQRFQTPADLADALTPRPIIPAPIAPAPLPTLPVEDAALFETPLAMPRVRPSGGSSAVAVTFGAVFVCIVLVVMIWLTIRGGL